MDEELEELDLFTWTEEDLAKPIEQSPKFDYLKSIGNNFKKIKEKDKKLNAEINNKVDKEEGNGLSTNDFNNGYKQKLDELQNYDDTEIKQKLDDIDITIQDNTIHTHIIKVMTEIKELTEYELPCNYVVGTESLDIFFNNEKLIRETSIIDGNFREIGAVGQLSNKVMFGWDIEPGSVLEIRVKGDTANEESN